MIADIERILLNRDEIQERVRGLAREISAVYENAESGLTLVPILSGSIIFLADLIRQLPLKMKMALIQVSTYRDRATTAGEPRTLLELSGEVAGRHVLIVDDILDSGRTLTRVQETIRRHEPASLRTVVLLRKPDKAPSGFPVDFVGFDIEDLFVVGYGLDFGDHYRNLPDIGVLRPELMA